MSEIEIPSIMEMPPKMYSIVSGLKEHKFILAEGGRGSGKTQSIARILLTAGDAVRLRVVCGRETQASIESSVYTVLSDLIKEYNLIQYEVLRDRIRHTVNGTEYKFMGFREQGSENTKGLEGVDIVWIDEAQMISERTLQVLIPTLRKENSKFIFTMNRYMRDDPVYTFLSGDDRCLHIKLNYYDNPFCPATLIEEAEKMRVKNENEYKHVWLGEPLEGKDDYLFNVSSLYSCEDKVIVGGQNGYYQRVMGIDFAAQGNDMCVATIMDRVSNSEFKVVDVIAWNEPDSMKSVGRIVQLIGQYCPYEVTLDVGGMGHVVHNRLTEVGVNLHRFDGASTQGVDTTHYYNARAEGYYLVKDWIESGFLIVPKAFSNVLKELEKIKVVPRSDGRRLIQAKHLMKKEMGGKSPDFADSLMMAIWTAVKFLNTHSKPYGSKGVDNNIRRMSLSKRRI